MKHAKLLSASIGFLVSGALGCLIVAIWFPRDLEGKSNLTGHPHWISAILWGAGGVACLWWALKGVQGLSLYFSGIEEEKRRWEEQFSQRESAYRGGSRRMVVILGVIAIVAWLLVGLYLR